MKYGLSDQQLKEIKAVLASYEAVEEAILFGSRAIDTFKEASDVDIAIKGKKADWSLAATLKDHLEEETYLPFFFDVVAYDKIESEALKRHIDEKGVVLYKRGMSEWGEVRLGDVSEITSSKRIFYSDYVKVGIPFWRSKEVIELFNRKNISTDLFITSEKYSEIKSKFGVPQEDDILLTSVGTLGIPYLVKSDDYFYFKDGNLTWIRKIDNLSLLPKYLYIWLSSRVGHDALYEITIGSTQEALTIRGLKTLQILLPPLPEQKAIAEVLSSLDDKIDLLHRQNKTLEQMAETLFRQWFVVEAGEDWGEGVLPDEFDFLMGQSPKGSSFNENKIGMPMFQGNADFGFRFPSERVYTTEPKRLAQPLDTLISVRAPVGAQNMAEKECCIGRGVAAFRYKANHEFYTYTYFKLESLMEEIKKFNDEGTVFGSISKGDFQKMEIVIPPDGLVKKFEIKVKPINDKVIKNCGQIRTLQSLRDTLLPKLMSGEVRVNFKEAVK